MFEALLNIFRRRKIRKFISNVPTEFVPLERISTVNVIVDVEDPGFVLLNETILEWGRSKKLKMKIYYFDFRKLGKEVKLMTDIRNTVVRRDLSLAGTPSFEKIGALVEEPSDLFISMVNNCNFPVEFLCKCTKARFKIGRCGVAGDVYNMVVTSNPTEDLTSESSHIFRTIIEFIDKIR